eukprot:SAG31_NODE_462_length_15340_cov_2.972968_10_plen_281_part_00
MRRTMPASLAAAVAFSIAATALAAPPLPLPFTRILHLVSPPLGGGDIVILQNLLHRSDGCAFALPRSHAGDYDAATARAVSCFQTHVGLAADGVVGPNTARALLRTLSADGWRDDGRSAGEQGYKYKILLPVHTNRSVETVGTLLDAHNNELLRFPAHSHGHDCDEDGQRIDGIPWPDLTDDGCPDAALKQGKGWYFLVFVGLFEKYGTLIERNTALIAKVSALIGCIGLNEFSSDGATPTGLTEIDLNSPESASDERLYGPYPVNRCVSVPAGSARPPK